MTLSDLTYHHCTIESRVSKSFCRSTSQGFIKSRPKYFYNVLMLINVGFEVLTLPKPAQNQDIDSTMSPKS